MKKNIIGILFVFLFLVTATLLMSGTTAALFSDSFENPSNSFSTGRVYINLNQGNDTQFLNVDNLMPGQASASPFTISNSGTLDFYYTIQIITAGVLVEGEHPLEFSIQDFQGNLITSNTKLFLSAGEEETLSVNWYMPLEAGNEYQGATASLGLFVHASQAVNLTDLP